MGKKKKNKIRRLLREQALQLEKTQPVAPVASPASVPGQTEQASQDQLQSQKVDDSESEEVKKDIKKILLTIAVLVIIIVAVYLVNIKSDFILKLGVWLSNALNINV